jgi:hypothetical protein
MVGGADVGLCPKCGSERWYKTRLLDHTGHEGKVWNRSPNGV